jgi:hypothetical protein
LNKKYTIGNFTPIANSLIPLSFIFHKLNSLLCTEELNREQKCKYVEKQLQLVEFIVK